MEFTFEPSPWDLTLDRLSAGDSISALRCLEMLESQTEDAVEMALLSLEERGIALDVSDLPLDGGKGDAAVRLRLEQKLAKSGALQSSLEENDPLRLYLEELSAIPVTGNIDELTAKYLAGDDDVGKELVNLSLPLVVERSCAMTGRGVLLLDLIQEASLGLWQGVLNYAEGDFESHIRWWIDQYLAKAVLMQAISCGIGEKIRQGMADYTDADQRLLAELGRNPTVEEIADSLHITAEEAATYASMLMQAKVRQKVDKTIQPEETSEEEDQSADNTAYFQMRQRITEMLSTLSPREAEVISLRFGLEGGLPQSPEQTGAALGMTPDEVIKIEASALSKLRQQTDEGGT
ncbi:MAG: sigma-70 family RNA polymerase sigma factor [Oscillospiraceae bacterium]|nr:sigma-70 family RNA polymerase sigma factor [Oscillospiraceae bacterium]